MDDRIGFHAKKSVGLLLAARGGVLRSLLVSDLGLGDKRIDTKLGRLNATGDAQFVSTMGVLLGPDFTSGNAARN